jgi:hypothetical protein
MKVGQSGSFDFDLAQAAGGWKRPGRIRIQADRTLAGMEWEATFNGEPISATSDVSEPFPVPYPSMLAKPDELAAWTIPAKLAKEGRNRFNLTLKSGESPSVQFVDLVMK